MLSNCKSPKECTPDKSAHSIPSIASGSTIDKTGLARNDKYNAKKSAVLNIDTRITNKKCASITILADTTDMTGIADALTAERSSSDPCSHKIGRKLSKEFNKSISPFVQNSRCVVSISRPKSVRKNRKQVASLLQSIKTKLRPGPACLFIGDSYFERFLWSHEARNPFSKYLAPFKPHICAVGGDSVAHAVWRLDEGGIRAAIAQAREQGYLSSVVLMVGLNDVACVRECHANEGYITAICDGISYIVSSLCEVMCAPISINVQRRDQRPSVHVVTVPVMPGWPEWKVHVAQMVNAHLLEKSAFANTLACTVRAIDFNDLELESPVHKRFLSDHIHLNEKGYERFARIIARSLGSPQKRGREEPPASGDGTCHVKINRLDTY